MNYILFDAEQWSHLLPLTYTRPVSEIRCGILTIKEKWEKDLGASLSYATRRHLNNKFPNALKEENCFIASHMIPNEELINAIHSLDLGMGLSYEGKLVAYKAELNSAEQFVAGIAKGNVLSTTTTKDINVQFDRIEQPWEIFQHNGEQIKKDIERLGLKPNTNQLRPSNTLIGEEVYLAEGAKVEGAILNSTDGPIYIGKDAEVMEGAVIRGPFALCEHATIKMSAKVYGDTTIGPHCKVGGEVSNVVMFGYSNKGHDGFIGNSVIGEWCNFGADTNSSNLKNNYSPIRVWSYKAENAVETGLQFCGLIAADHCKTGINTMLNTGTVMGVSANVFGGGFPAKFIPSFSWGGAENLETFKLGKAYEVAESMMKRRGIDLTEDDKEILQHVFLSDSLYRQ